MVGEGEALTLTRVSAFSAALMAQCVSGNRRTGQRPDCRSGRHAEIVSLPTMYCHLGAQMVSDATHQFDGLERSRLPRRGRATISTKAHSDCRSAGLVMHGRWLTGSFDLFGRAIGQIARHHKDDFAGVCRVDGESDDRENHRIISMWICGAERALAGYGI